MSTRKRRASTRVIRPTSRASVEHGGLEPTDDATQDIESPSPRRSKRVKREVKCEPEIEDLEDSLHVTKQRAIARRSSKSKTKRPGASSIPQVPEKLHPEPPNWRATYAAIKKMRARIIPPVDQMGCQVVQNAETDPKCKRYSTLVALMLSSQTKDAAMFPATVRLREALGGSISIQAMIAVNDEVISEAIKGVGFWRKKTGYLKQTAIKLRDEFDSDVPQTADELCSLPGVGPKMAFLCLQMAWNMHVSCLSQRIT
ncbi:hypothetical protein NLJ89_g9780 [Agrocybe chaxingu]|uniref:DNA-(apurinic or apyrimidinic site) lyase n=1 Tax=Agrocybe chaxingu TaxID=84603 RepID=A0A9W8JS18_9AGAR|nr:hypothetical protein NLJ89_g9780 [Agrocybe chaxingu]